MESKYKVGDKVFYSIRISYGHIIYDVRTIVEIIHLPSMKKTMAILSKKIGEPNDTEDISLNVNSIIGLANPLLTAWYE